MITLCLWGQEINEGNLTPSDVVLISVDIFPWGAPAANEFSLGMEQKIKNLLKQKFTKRNMETHCRRAVTESECNLQGHQLPVHAILTKYSIRLNSPIQKL